MSLVLYRFFIFQFFVLIFSCGQNQNSDHHSALPHAVQSMENKQPVFLSEKDKAILKEANGRKVSSISYADLVNRFEFASSALNLILIWKLDCRPCDNMATSLKDIQLQFGEQNIKLIFVNTNPKYLEKQVNLHIRNIGMTGEIFQIDRKSLPLNLPLEEIKLYQDVPTLYMINNEKDFRLVYQEELSKKHIIEIIKPTLRN